MPVILLLVLAVMGYMGLDLLRTGHGLRYFSTLAGGLVIIALIYWRLRKKEKARMKAADDAQYGPYPQDADKK